MPNKPLEHKDIIKLLSELKEGTPEYPVHMMSNRKAAFLQKAIDIKVSKGDDSSQSGQKGGKSGTGGAGASGSGASLRNKPFFLGLSLKQIVAIGLVLVLFVTAYFMRDQITEVVTQNNVANAGETAAPSTSYRLAGTPTITPTPRLSGGGLAGDTEEHSIVESPESTAKVPGDSLGQESGAPTPPAGRSPASAFRYLFCVLGLGGDNCQ